MRLCCILLKKHCLQFRHASFYPIPRPISDFIHPHVDFRILFSEGSATEMKTCSLANLTKNETVLRIGFCLFRVQMFTFLFYISNIMLKMDVLRFPHLFHLLTASFIRFTAKIQTKKSHLEKICATADFDLFLISSFSFVLH